MLSARYEHARECAQELQKLAHRYRLDFAETYGRLGAAQAGAGLRNWKEADEHVRIASEVARSRGDEHAEQAWFTVGVRVLAQRGKYQQALALEIPELGAALPEARVEVLGAVALVLACVGKVDESLALIEDVRGTTRTADSVCVLAAVDVVASLKRRERHATDRVLELEATAFETGALDILVNPRTALTVQAVLERSDQPA